MELWRILPHPQLPHFSSVSYGFSFEHIPSVLFLFILCVFIPLCLNPHGEAERLTHSLLYPHLPVSIHPTSSFVLTWALSNYTFGVCLFLVPTTAPSPPRYECPPPPYVPLCSKKVFYSHIIGCFDGSLLGQYRGACISFPLLARTHVGRTPKGSGSVKAVLNLRALNVYMGGVYLPLLKF